MICPVGREALDRVGATAVEVAAAWLGVFAIALARLDGEGRVPVLAGLEAGNRPVPMPIVVDEDAGFADAVRDLAQDYHAAKPGALFAPLAIRNIYARGARAAGPKIEAGVRIVAKTADPAELRQAAPGLSDKIWLVLEVRADQVALVCDAQGLDPANLEALAAYIARVAKDASRDPFARIETLGVDSNAGVPAPAAEATFDF